ncbi:copper homeostasis CutC domain-containing protein [Cytidiella melzeri]|nr:copper homeostasis CutC domain-containing protein [Cytidiella melzeri]
MTLPSNSFVIEVCVDSVESAVAAVRGGANRLELCGNIGVGGGTTPSIGLFRQVKKSSPNVRIMVMIRPRTGDFLYTLWEVDSMVEDIRAYKAAGADGVVFGVLDAYGKVDVRTTSRLVREALPMEVCFHRAFDMTVDAADSFSKISQITGITRILTSGLGQKAVLPTSLEILKDLLESASAAENGQKLTILPGSGINAGTVQEVLSALLPHGLTEIHLSAGAWVPSAMRFRRERMGMGVGGAGEWGIWRTSESAVRSVREIVDEALEKRNGVLQVAVIVEAAVDDSQTVANEGESASDSHSVALDEEQMQLVPIGGADDISTDLVVRATAE